MAWYYGMVPHVCHLQGLTSCIVCHTDYNTSTLFHLYDFPDQMLENNAFSSMYSEL